MKYIKYFENNNVNLQSIANKFEEFLNHIKKLDDISNSCVLKSIFNQKNKKYTITYKLEYSYSWNVIKIEIKKHMGLNFKPDYIQINIESIYSDSFRYVEKIKNIVNFSDFFKINLNNYISSTDQDSIEIKVPINKINEFYKELDYYYAYVNSELYNL
jgi:hypothetical protein